MPNISGYGESDCNELMNGSLHNKISFVNLTLSVDCVMRTETVMYRLFQLNVVQNLLSELKLSVHLELEF